MTFSQPREWPTKAPANVREAYEHLRVAAERLECMLEDNGDGLDAKALKRSDKAVTVMKVGFKILKKAIRKNGRTKIKAAA